MEKIEDGGRREGRALNGKFTVEVLGYMIVVTIEGALTIAILNESHAQIMEKMRETGAKKILFDGMKLVIPSDDLAIMQWKLNEEFDDLAVRRAIVVPDTRLAYLARIAFAEGNYRVFYDDRAAAIRWLHGDSHP